MKSASGASASAAAGGVVLARVCESELATVRRATMVPVPPMRRSSVVASAAKFGQTNGASGSSATTNGAPTSDGQAVGINADSSSVSSKANVNEEDPYAELEFYLENVKVSERFFYVLCL